MTNLFEGVPAAVAEMMKTTLPHALVLTRTSGEDIQSKALELVDKFTRTLCSALLDANNGNPKGGQ